MVNSIDPRIIAAQAAVSAHVAALKPTLDALASKTPIFANLPLLFSNAYQNPILTTAVMLTPNDGVTPPMTYAGTGGWGCFGPPPQALPLDPDNTGYPNSLSNMWIRDACAQYHAYLGIFEYNKSYNTDILALGQVIEGIVRTCCTFLIQNRNDTPCTPFPNWPSSIPNCITHHAFNYNGVVPQAGCDYEPDSLAYVIFLAVDYYTASGSKAHLDTTFWTAMQAIIDVVNYFLQAFDAQSALTLTPCRPSDDPCVGKYNIPINAFLASMMHQLAVLAANCGKPIAESAAILANQLRNGVNNYGKAANPKQPVSSIYAYEVNFTEQIGPIIMDDANIPSLLSLPYLNFCAYDDPLYLRTRNDFVLTSHNPYFYQGTDQGVAYEGVGSPHVQLNQHGGNTKSIWPLAIMMRGLTSVSADEIRAALAMITQSANTTYSCSLTGYGCACDSDFTTYPAENYQHETFDADNITWITRGWFAWANALFGEWVDLMVRNGSLPTS